MSDYKPFTSENREFLRLGAKDILENSEGRYIAPVPFALERLRYEASLQAKDAQIIELAQAILDAGYDDLQRPRELARAAIKEATCS